MHNIFPTTTKKKKKKYVKLSAKLGVRFYMDIIYCLSDNLIPLCHKVTSATKVFFAIK